jgi:hypothetical protein
MNVNCRVTQVTIPQGAVESEVFDIGGAHHIAFALLATHTGSNLGVLVAAAQEGPFAEGGVNIEATEGPHALAASENAQLAPFRWLKLLSSSPFEPPEENEYSSATQALAGAGQIQLGNPNVGDGLIVAGDTFIAGGHATVYTITNADPVSVAGDDPIITFTPVLAFNAEEDDVLTFSFVGARGELAARTVQVITKG